MPKWAAIYLILFRYLENLFCKSLWSGLFSRVSWVTVNKQHFSFNLKKNYSDQMLPLPFFLILPELVCSGFGCFSKEIGDFSFLYSLISFRHQTSGVFLRWQNWAQGLSQCHIGLHTRLLLIGRGNLFYFKKYSK